MSKHLLVVVTSHADLGHTGRKTGYFLSELTHPYRVFKDAGYRITIASPRGGKAPLDERSFDLSDQINRWFMDSREDQKLLDHTMPLSEVLTKDIDAIFFAGGHGAVWDFPDNRDVLRLTQNIWDGGGVVAAVCHGSAALVNAREESGDYIVAGRKVTGFTNAEERSVELDNVVPFMLETKLEQHGAKFQSGASWQSHIEVDDRLVTGQNPASAAAVGRAIVDLLSVDSA